MLKQMSVEEIKKLEKEQQKLAKEIPFKVKYEIIIYGKFII